MVIIVTLANVPITTLSVKVLKTSITASGLKFKETTSFESGASTNSAISPFLKTYYTLLIFVIKA